MWTAARRWPASTGELAVSRVSASRTAFSTAKWRGGRRSSIVTRTRQLPELDFVTAWLDDNRPTMSPAGIIPRDYSPFNVMVAPEPPARLEAIVDWDTGTIGDPLLDIGHLLARWTEPGEKPISGEQAGGVHGYPTRAEMAKRYEEQTGRDLGALPYCETLALFKLAVILEGTFAPGRAAGVPDAENSMGEIVPRPLIGAARFARGELA